MAKNKAEKAADKAIKELEKVHARIASDIQRRIDAGQDPRRAVDAAVKAAGYKAVLTDEILDGISTLVSKETGLKMGLGQRKWFLNHVWKGDDMSLSARINDISRMTDIKNSITTSMRAADTWNQMANRLLGKDLTKADLPQHLTDLVSASRRVLGGDASAVAEYKKALERSIGEVERLAQNGAPTGRLKAAYENVISQTKAVSKEALDKSVDRAIREKARYNAERIARTEIAKAYAQETYKEALDDEQVIGIGYDLNDGHPKTDECNFVTGVDLFGLGAGRYPLDALPTYPVHPQCICNMYNVYSGDATKIDKGAAEDYLKDMDVEDRRALLGVDGEKEFRKDPSTWEDNLRNYEGHKDIKTLMEADL